MGSSPQAGREEEDGGSLAKLEGGKENWDIMDETPQGRLWDRSSLSQGWAAGQGARKGVRAQSAQGGATKERPNRKGWISSSQRGFFGCSGLLQSALCLLIMGPLNPPSTLRKGLQDTPGKGQCPSTSPCIAQMLQLKKKKAGMKFP